MLRTYATCNVLHSSSLPHKLQEKLPSVTWPLACRSGVVFRVLQASAKARTKHAATGRDASSALASCFVLAFAPVRKTENAKRKNKRRHCSPVSTVPTYTEVRFSKVSKTFPATEIRLNTKIIILFMSSLC